MTKHSLALTVAFAFLLGTPSAFAWGREGHHLVARIADSHLDPGVKTQIGSLLGNETLVTISTWPDEVRHDRDETAGWHYVDIPRSAAFFDDARDCYQPYSNHKNADSDHQNCVVDRIELFENVLADTHQPKEVRVEALKFLVHFVGDIHQPMHAIEEAAGGNQIKVILFGNRTCGERQLCNLHSAWDSGMIEHTGLDEAAYAQKLAALIQTSHLEHDVAGRPADWANESHRLAEGALLEQDGSVDELYFQNEIRVVDERLALAGLRLANALNFAFGTHTHEVSQASK